MNPSRRRVTEMLDSNLVRTAGDYANAAMIFQHGGDTLASGLAVRLMRTATELDPDRSKWLLAAAIDRDLMRRGQPQIYGTQYTRNGEDEPWRRYTIDSTRVTDEERAVYGVESLAEQRAKVKRMNQKQLGDLHRQGTPLEDILVMIQRSETDTYDTSEGGLNTFGYQLLRDGETDAALKVFKLNTERHPTSFNPFDSYGEALLAAGRTEEGIAAYERSVELNPDNAVRVLRDLGVGE